MSLAHSNEASALIDSIQSDLERLRGLIHPQAATLFNPKDPRNKTADGKLTPRGVEICYRLFDAGKTRYAVCQEMEISFGAATHRLERGQRKVGIEYVGRRSAPVEL